MIHDSLINLLYAIKLPIFIIKVVYTYSEILRISKKNMPVLRDTKYEG